MSKLAVSSTSAPVRGKALQTPWVGTLWQRSIYFICFDAGYVVVFATNRKIAVIQIKISWSQSFHCVLLLLSNWPSFAKLRMQDMNQNANAHTTTPISGTLSMLVGFHLRPHYSEGPGICNMWFFEFEISKDRLYNSLLFTFAHYSSRLVDECNLK